MPDPIIPVATPVYVVNQSSTPASSVDVNIVGSVPITVNYPSTTTTLTVTGLLSAGSLSVSSPITGTISNATSAVEATQLATQGVAYPLQTSITYGSYYSTATAIGQLNSSPYNGYTPLSLIGAYLDGNGHLVIQWFGTQTGTFYYSTNSNVQNGEV